MKDKPKGPQPFVLMHRPDRPRAKWGYVGSFATRAEAEAKAVGEGEWRIRELKPLASKEEAVATTAPAMEPAMVYALLHRRPGARKWRRVGGFATRTAAVMEMNGPGDFRIEEVRQEQPTGEAEA